MQNLEFVKTIATETMASNPKLCNDMIGELASFIPWEDLQSIMKIGDESNVILKRIKSYVINETPKLIKKGKMMNIQLGSISTMALERMDDSDKNRWIPGVISKVSNDIDDWEKDALCHVLLLLRVNDETMLKPEEDKTLWIKFYEPKWLPCYCDIEGQPCWLCQDKRHG